MGEENVELIEKMIENTVDDVKELKSDYKDLKREVADIHRKQSVTENAVQQFNMMLTNLEKQIRELRDDMKLDKEEERKRYEQDKRDQKNRWWGLVFLLIGAVVLIQLGLR